MSRYCSVIGQHQEPITRHLVVKLSLRFCITFACSLAQQIVKTC